MISGMRVRRRSAFKVNNGYLFYRISISQSEASNNVTVRIANINMVTEDFPSGVVSGGTATASSFLSATYAPSVAFNTNTSTYWVTSTSDTIPTWIQYEFATPQVVTEYRIRARNNSNASTRAAPRVFEFLGSNDGVTWKVLDSQSVGAWSAGLQRTFVL